MVIDQVTTNANQLRDVLLGSGVIPVGNATLVSGANSAGIFSGGSTSIQVPTGIVLSSGNVQFVAGPNVADASTGLASMAGDASLNTLFGVTTRDTTYLQFDFQLAAGGPTSLYFNYVFASEEYNEFANTIFNDVFAFFLDGQNIALIPGTNTPVSINNINGGNPLGVNPQNPQYYNNNDPSEGGLFMSEFGMDGFTDVLTATVQNLSPGVHTIKLAVSDVGDFSLNTAVFLQRGSFSNTETGIPAAGGDWRSVKLDRFSNDRNVGVTNEMEAAYTGGRDVNGLPDTAELLGKLAPNEKSGDENRRLGFEVHGFISPDAP